VLGLDGLSKSDSEAAHWFRKAAEQGYAIAQYNLAVMYESGQGVSVDPVEASAWYLKAAEQGQADSEYKIGACYQNGKGVKQDFVVAVLWLQKAADQGNADAKHNLGEAYRLGQGVPQDFRKAMALFCDAAMAGNVRAMDSCGYGYLIGGAGVSPDLVKSITWSMLAVENSSAGDVLNKAVVNLRNANARAKPEQVAEAKRDAESIRVNWATRSVKVR